MSTVSLVIFEGGTISGQLEEDMRLARQGIVLDQIVKAHGAGFERIILCTPYRAWQGPQVILTVPSK